MIVSNSNRRFSSVASNPTALGSGLAARVRQYLAGHPEVSPEEFLLDAVGRELTLRNGPGTGLRAVDRPPLTAEDVRFHIWLNERLAMLHRERHGLWPRIRRFFFGA